MGRGYYILCLLTFCTKIGALGKKILCNLLLRVFDNAEEADGVKIASAYFTGTTGDTLRGMCDSIRDKAVNPVVAVLVGKAEDKITMAVTVNKLAHFLGWRDNIQNRAGRTTALFRWQEKCKRTDTDLERESRRDT